MGDPFGYYCGGLIAFAIILIWMIHGRRSHSDYLYGFWTAEGDGFCEESDIDSMMLFIGYPGDSGERSAYLVVSPDVCSYGMEIQLSGSWWSFGDTYKWRANITADETPIWPEIVNILVSKSDGTLRVVDDDGVLYASLSKQNDITNTARLATAEI